MNEEYEKTLSKGSRITGSDFFTLLDKVRSGLIAFHPVAELTAGYYIPDSVTY
jgi:hypothetical protein